MRVCGGVLAIAVAFCLESSGFEVRQVFLQPRWTRGDTNVRRQQPMDDAQWIWRKGDDKWGVSVEKTVLFADRDEGRFYRFRNEFESDGSALRFDVSADERFVLYLDGQAVARGPQRGMVEHWYYQSYEITGLGPGRHVMDAVVWQLGIGAPMAQISYRGGFVMKAFDGADKALTTPGDWKVAPLVNTVMTDWGTSRSFGVGTQCHVTGTGYPREEPKVAWERPEVVRRGVRDTPSGGRTRGWMLFPADRPDQIHVPMTPGRIVNADVDVVKPFTVPANATLDLWWDLGGYYCAYPELEASGGKGAVVTWGWTESLLDAEGRKGNRDEWKGKAFAQTFTDTFVSDGRADAFFTTPWWRCGRWCRVTVRTADEPLAVKRLQICDSRYPLDVDAAFSCDDRSLDAVFGLSLRTVQMCMHEMLFDCPYYEQLMYPGDTRIQLQVLNALTRDARMARFAMSVFDFARRDNGMVPMNFPDYSPQESVTYTLCWLQMFRDFMMWHDDAAFLRIRMPGARSALMGVGQYENADGLLEDLPGWSFMDWVDGDDQPFPDGNAPDGGYGKGVSSLNNLLYLLALQSVAEVDEAIGEKELAAVWRGKAQRLGRKILETFWDEGRGLLADTVRKDRFSEHGQSLAILAGLLDPARRMAALAGLEKGEGLARASSYFAYYLFDAYTRCGRGDLVMRRFRYWRDYLSWGAKTAFETQRIDSRSDCHAWSACPLYFMQTTFAGVTPAAPFFRRARIAPQPAGLTHIGARTPCPQGEIRTDLVVVGKAIRGTVELPVGLSGDFEWNGTSRPLVPGINRIDNR